MDLSGSSSPKKATTHFKSDRLTSYDYSSYMIAFFIIMSIITPVFILIKEIMGQRKKQ
jgi:hypothetical protein